MTLCVCVCVCEWVRAVVYQSSFSAFNRCSICLRRSSSFLSSLVFWMVRWIFFPEIAERRTVESSEEDEEEDD